MGLNNYFDREKNATNTSYLKRRFGISESASEDILKESKVRRSEVGTNPVSLGMKTFGTVEVADASSLLDEKDDVPSFMQTHCHCTTEYVKCQRVSHCSSKTHTTGK